MSRKTCNNVEKNKTHLIFGFANKYIAIVNF